MKRYLAIAASAALVLRVAAATAGVPEPAGYRMADYNAPVPDTVAGGRVLHTADLNLFIAAQKPLLIDVLPAPRRPEGMAADAPWLPLPHRDIPGSVWLPGVGRGALDPKTERWFQNQLLRLSLGDLSRPIVFYCRAQCWMSWNATKRAAQNGFTNPIWYPEGADGWEAAGLPVETIKPEEMPN